MAFEALDEGNHYAYGSSGFSLTPTDYDNDEHFVIIHGESGGGDASVADEGSGTWTEILDQTNAFGDRIWVFRLTSGSPSGDIDISFSGGGVNLPHASVIGVSDLTYEGTIGPTSYEAGTGTDPRTLNTSASDGPMIAAFGYKNSPGLSTATSPWSEASETRDGNQFGLSVHTVDEQDDEASWDFSSNATTGIAIAIEFSEASATVYTLTAESGSMILTGTAANLEQHRAVDAEPGAIDLTGTEALFLRDLIMEAESGAVELSGADATLSKGFVMAAEGGSVVLTGTAAQFLRDIVMPAESGGVVLTGTNAGLLRGLIMGAEGGFVVLAGTEVTFVRDFAVQAEPGAINLAGTDAAFLRDLIMEAESGSIVLTGTDVSLEVAIVLSAEAGGIVLSPTDASLLADYLMDAESGSVVLTGAAASLVADRTIAAEEGEVVLTGTQASLLLDAVLDAEPGSILLTGADAGLRYSEDYVIYVFGARAGRPTRVVVAPAGESTRVQPGRAPRPIRVMN